MASNLDCIGLGVESQADLKAMVDALLPRSESIGAVQGLDVRRWEDASGSRLILGVEGSTVVDLLPSFAGPVSVHLANVGRLDPDVASAEVVDTDGETLTVLALELEERRFLGMTALNVDVTACVVALGVEVAVYQDEAAFSESPGSFLSGSHEGEEPPPVYAERGLKWPPRMAAESFISTGSFGTTPDAHAVLNGTVVAPAERRTNTVTGQQFLVTTVRTVGFDASVCIPGRSLEVDPEIGNILGGAFFLAGSIPSLVPEGKSEKRRNVFRRRH